MNVDQVGCVWELFDFICSGGDMKCYYTHI